MEDINHGEYIFCNRSSEVSAELPTLSNCRKPELPKEEKGPCLSLDSKVSLCNLQTNCRGILCIALGCCYAALVTESCSDLGGMSVETSMFYLKTSSKKHLWTCWHIARGNEPCGPTSRHRY